jgi:hypothetical protein
MATQQDGSQSWCNIGQVEVIKNLLLQCYAFQAANRDQINPANVMIISPYNDQKKMIQERLEKSGVGYQDNLTIDVAQGQESPIVILSLTKPSKDSPLSLGFIADRQRLNVALSRAQKVLIVIGNLVAWDQPAIKKMRQMSRKNDFLASLLTDVTQKSHTISWADSRAIEQTEPPGPAPVQYFFSGGQIIPPSLQVE